MPCGHTVKVGDDWVDGMLVGRAAALSDWAFKKEQREFEKLCVRLQSRNWARLERVRNPERVRARLQRWRDANREHVRELDRNRRRQRRMETVKPCVCEECRATWKPVDGRRRSRFCSRKCRNRWHAVRRAAARNRGIRNMKIAPTVMSILAREPWLTRAEILKRSPELKPGSLATKLSDWERDGVLVSTKRHRRRYAIAGAAP